MSKELRELGSRQLKILTWVALHPNQYGYEIHKGLGDIAQGNVDSDCKKLKEYGYLESEKSTASEKYQRKVEKYRCTEKGLLYALLKKRKNTLALLKLYREKYDIFDFLSKVHDKQPNIYNKLLDTFEEALPNLDKKLSELVPLVIPYVLTIMSDANDDEFIAFLDLYKNYSPENQAVYDSMKKKLLSIFNIKGELIDSI